MQKKKSNLANLVTTAAASAAAGGGNPTLTSRPRQLWVKCTTPTTGRAYYIHRKTGKISWQEPADLKVGIKSKQVQTKPVLGTKDAEASGGNSSGSTGNSSVSESHATKVNHVLKKDNVWLSSTPPVPINSDMVLSQKVTSSQFRLASPSAKNSNAEGKGRKGSSGGLTIVRRVMKKWFLWQKSIGFNQWKLFTAVHREALKTEKVQRKLNDNINAAKLQVARSELAIAKAEVDAWERAKSEKTTALHRLGSHRVMKWLRHKDERPLRGAWNRWSCFIRDDQKKEILLLRNKIADIETQERKKQFTDTRGDMHGSSGVEVRGTDQDKSQSNLVKSKDDVPEWCRQAKAAVSDANDKISKLQAEKEILQKQVAKLTADCASVQEKSREWEQLATGRLDEIDLLRKSMGGKTSALQESAKVWEKLAKGRLEELETLRSQVVANKRNWLQRFQEQQETIERLEADVDELSELKVLELADNYYEPGM